MAADVGAHRKMRNVQLAAMQPFGRKETGWKKRPFSNPIRFLPLDPLDVTQDFVW